MVAVIVYVHNGTVLTVMTANEWALFVLKKMDMPVNVQVLAMTLKKIHAIMTQIHVH